jgi:hypothetical protein
MDIPVRIIPGFGADILPESVFLKKGCAVNKWGPSVIQTPDGKTVMNGKVLHFVGPEQLTLPRGGGPPVRPCFSDHDDDKRVRRGHRLRLCTVYHGCTNYKGCGCTVYQGAVYANFKGSA